jgi:hypothetical protein
MATTVLAVCVALHNLAFPDGPPYTPPPPPPPARTGTVELIAPGGMAVGAAVPFMGVASMPSVIEAWGVSEAGPATGSSYGSAGAAHASPAPAAPAQSGGGATLHTSKGGSVSAHGSVWAWLLMLGKPIWKACCVCDEDAAFAGPIYRAHALACTHTRAQAHTHTHTQKHPHTHARAHTPTHT